VRIVQRDQGIQIELKQRYKFYGSHRHVQVWPLTSIIPDKLPIAQVVV
jgi:hypothetical protein